VEVGVAVDAVARWGGCVLLKRVLCVCVCVMFYVFAFVSVCVYMLCNSLDQTERATSV